MSASLSQPYTAPYFIKYNPALKIEFGSQNAVILFDRLEYWFSKKKNQFYKFIEPCQHDAYKTGDSWSEELGFSKKVFKTAFDKIGIRYISKTAFDKEVDPFKGKLFAYYQDRQTKKTIFVRNNTLLKDLYAKLKSILQEKVAKPIGEGASVSTVASFKKGSPTARPLVSPHVGATKDKQINTSSKKDNDNFLNALSPVSEVMTQQAQIAHDIKEVWEEEIGRRGLVKLTDKSIPELVRAFKTNFQGSLDLWRKHCTKIASSQFLMGEKQGINFEIKILFALSKKFIDQLADGKYEMNTRDSNHAKRVKALEEKVKSIAVKKEMLDTQLGHLEDEKKLSQKKLLSEKIKNLTPEKLDGFKSSYEELMRTATTGEGGRFRENGWSDNQVQFMFELFVTKQIEKKLGEETLASEDIVKKKNYLQETLSHLQTLYDIGLKALRELRSLKTNFYDTSLIKPVG